MALKQNLQQKLGLKINPLQIQLIKLLELPTFQLEQRIKEELESNPLLEEGGEEPELEYAETENEFESQEEGQEDNDDDFTLEDYLSDDDDTPDYKLNVSNASKDEDAKDFIFSQGTTFRESLIDQLGVRSLSELQRKVAEYIIGNIDDDGYLRRDVENIVDDLAFGAGIEVSEKEVGNLNLLEWEPGICRSACCCKSVISCRKIRKIELYRMRRKFWRNVLKNFPANIMRKYNAGCVFRKRN